MLERFKAPLYGTASALAIGVLFYFVVLWITGSVRAALMCSAVPVASFVPIIGVFAFVAMGPVGMDDVEDDAGYRRHLFTFAGAYTLSYFPLFIGAFSLLAGRTGLGAILLGVYVLMVILLIRSLVRVRRTLEYRASQG